MFFFFYEATGLVIKYQIYVFYFILIHPLDELIEIQKQMQKKCSRGKWHLGAQLEKEKKKSCSWRVLMNILHSYLNDISNSVLKWSVLINFLARIFISYLNNNLAMERTKFVHRSNTFQVLLNQKCCFYPVFPDHHDYSKMWHGNGLTDFKTKQRKRLPINTNPSELFLMRQ